MRSGSDVSDSTDLGRPPSIVLPGILLGVGLGGFTHSRGRVWASPVLWGWVLTGWGLFNVVEGVLDHHILGIHHVISGPYQNMADLGFLGLGAMLILGGWALQHAQGPIDLTVARRQPQR